MNAFKHVKRGSKIFLVFSRFCRSLPAYTRRLQGQNFRHTAFDSHVYFFKEQTIAACYGRGVMPVSYIWTISGAFANGDAYNGARLFYAYGRLVFDSTARYFQDTAEFLKKKATGKSEL